MTRALAFLACLAAAVPVGAQEVGIVDAAITLSAGGRAELWFELEGGTEHRLRFEGEAVEVDGIGIGSYAERGGLESAWRDFLREHAGEDASAVRGGLVGFRRFLQEWNASGESADRDAARALAGRIDVILGLAMPSPVDAAAIPAGEPAPAISGQPRPMQIVPGGLGFDVTGELDRLRDALGRLGDSGDFIEDRLAMIVHGDYEVLAEATVPGDVAILDGTLRLAGDVDGNILVLDGALVLDGGARVRGDVLQVGGEVDFGDDAPGVEGEVLSDIRLAPSESSARTATDAPSVQRVESFEAPMRMRSAQPSLGSRLARNFGRAAEGVIAAGCAFTVLAALGLLLVYFGRRRLETVSDTVRLEFARSFAMGVAGEVLFLPVLLVLAVLVITWLVIPFFLLAAGLAGVFGYLAAAHAAGEIFARRRFRSEWLERLRRSNSYYYVVSGLAILMLPFAAGAALWVFGGAADFVRGLILFVAGVGTWVIVTAGFGGVLLTRAGGRSVVIDWSADNAAGEGASPGAGTDPPSAPSDDA
ncbi:MAG: polymer-forming cytoskeletal protein [Gemmatimonadetes bacterium]|nr:polymer-forming cytoskeletal protein [Candidatus Palauibacter australiensis]